MHLLEWLTEVRKLCLLAIYYQFIIKDMNQQLDERFKGEVLKGTCVFMELRAQHSGIWKHSGFPAWKLFRPKPLVFYGSFITQA